MQGGQAGGSPYQSPSSALRTVPGPPPESAACRHGNSLRKGEKLPSVVAASPSPQRPSWETWLSACLGTGLGDALRPCSGSSLGTVCSLKLLDGLHHLPHKESAPWGHDRSWVAQWAGVPGSWLCPDPSGGRCLPRLRSPSQGPSTSGGVDVSIWRQRCPPTALRQWPDPHSPKGGSRVAAEGCSQRCLCQLGWLLPVPGGSQWTWHSCSGVSSATWDPLFSTG